MKIARFDKRIIGWMLDELIPLSFGIVFVVLSIEFDFLTDSWAIRLLIGTLISYVFYLLSNSLFLFLTNGFTLGSVIVGIRTIHSNSSPITYRQAILKCLITGVIAFVIANAVYMLAARTERSVFDRLSNTVVAEYRHAND